MSLTTLKKKPIKKEFVWSGLIGVYTKANPNKVGLELESIRERDGAVTPQAVIERAQNPRSAMHDLFTWDDSKAAQLYRLTQARSIITHIRIVEQQVGGRKPQRLYLHTHTNVGEYTTIEDIRSVTEVAQNVKDAAVAELKAWMSRYQELERRLPEAFANVRSAINNLKRRGS